MREIAIALSFSVICILNLGLMAQALLTLIISLAIYGQASAFRRFGHRYYKRPIRHLHAKSRCHFTYELVQVVTYDTHYDEKCHHSYDKKCHMEYDLSFELKYGRECITTLRPLCTKLLHTVYIQKCDDDTRQKCYQEDGHHKCHTSSPYRDSRCHNSYECHGQKCSGTLERVKQKCQDDQDFATGQKTNCRQIAKKIPKKECIHVPQYRCKEYPIKTPQKIPRKECELIPKENCQKIPKKVPRKVLKVVPRKVCKRRRRKKKFRFFG